MLEVESPIPMTEGEMLGFGITTKHLAQGAVGAGIMLPFALVTWISGVPIGVSMAFVLVAGLVFAIAQVKQRSLGEIVLLHVRYQLRPKVLLYDREYRLRGETFLIGGRRVNE